MQPEQSTPLPADKPVRSLLAGDTVVYLGLLTLTALVWQISKQGYFEAGDDVGYWLGVAGGTMMLLLFSYPLRKHRSLAQLTHALRSVGPVPLQVKDEVAA